MPNWTMTGAATPTTSPSPGETLTRTLLSGSIVSNDPLMTTALPSVPTAVPAAVYFFP